MNALKNPWEGSKMACAVCSQEEEAEAAEEVEEEVK